MVGIVPDQTGKTNAWKNAPDLANRLVAVGRKKPTVIIEDSNTGFDDFAAVAKDLEAHKAQFEKKYEELTEELKSHWEHWDRALELDSSDERRGALDGMVDLLNRRSYIRNLVRDVNEALET